MRRLGALRPGIGLLISLVCIAGTGYWISQQPTPRFPTDAQSLIGLAAAGVLTLVLALIRGWRWKQILRAVGHSDGGREPYFLTSVAYMGNTVLPARGGDVLKVGLLTQRTNGDWKTITGTLVPERLLDVTALAALMVVLGSTSAVRDQLGMLPLMLAAAGIVAIATVIGAYHELRVRGHLATLADRVRPFTRATRVLLSLRGVQLFAVTVVLWLLEGVVLWTIVGSGSSASIDYPAAALVVVLASLVTAIPAAPGFLGTLDAAVIFGLQRAGLSGSEAFTVALQYRLVLFGPITIVGLLTAILRYGGIQRMRRLSRETEVAVEDELDGHPHPQLRDPAGR